MANVVLNGTLYPAIATEPTHEDIYGKGGHRSVNYYGDLLNIDSGFKTAGMTVFVINNQTTYMWDGSSWVVNGFIKDSSLSGSKLVNFSVDSYKIAPSAITTAHLQDDAVDNNKLSDNSVTNSKMEDGAAICIISPPTVLWTGTTASVGVSSDFFTISGETNTDSPCLAYLQVETYDTSGDFNFWPSGNMFTSGIGSVSMETSGKALISTFSSDEGWIEFTTSAPLSATISLISYIR